MTLKWKVETHGPLFDHDPAKTVRENIRTGLERWAEEAQGVIRSLTPVGPGRHGMHLSESIIGRTRSLKGKKWAVTAVVSPTINLHLPRYRGYASYIETGVRKGDIYGKVAREQVREVRKGSGYQGARMFGRGVSILRGRVKAALADLTRGLT